MTWTKLFPSGAWSVWDDRLYQLGYPHGRTYYGYSLRDAKQEHAAYVRELKARENATL